MYKAANYRLIKCKYFSISFGEITDINNICQLVICNCQLVICIKTVDANLNCFERMFEVVSLHGHMGGQALFDGIESKE